MSRTWIAYLLFGFGIFLMLIHTAIPSLWFFFGVSGAPPMTGESGLFYYLQGFTPPLGAIMMIIAGLVYGDAKDESNR